MSAFLRSPFKNNVKADAENNPHQRVVLLLDMDCFYAQCETVRLGLDQTLPLALVQVSTLTCIICTEMRSQHSMSQLVNLCCAM